MKICEERVTKMKQAQSTLRKLHRRDHGTGELDPAKLGATLRELAMRAHQLVRAVSETGPDKDDAERELAEVHAQIVRLQRNLGRTPSGRSGIVCLRAARAHRGVPGFYVQRVNVQGTISAIGGPSMSIFPGSCAKEN